jgi:hypothetical protein
MHRHSVAVLLLLAAALCLPLLATPTPAASAPQLQADLPPGGFVQPEGSQLVRVGEPVQLKGMFYLPQGYSAHDMWYYWDAPMIARELQAARDHTGINTVWIRLPYAVQEVTPEARISDEMYLRIRELLQIVGDLDMRVVFTLFEGYEAFPMPGRNSERLNLNYLDHLIGSFAGDERIVAWDIYHKPDRHSLWRSGEKERVLSWLVRMANRVQQLAPHQLVLVSMSEYQNVWTPDFDGHVLLDFVDVVTVRGKDSEDIRDDVAEIREQTDKPVILYDFFWPSGPPCREQKYTEARQALVHADMLTTLADETLAGAFMRAMHDIDSGPTGSWDDTGFYEGLYRLDYTPKQVYATLAAYETAALPNVTSSTLPLRYIATRPEPEVDPDLDPGIPVEIGASGLYVKRDFRRAWDTFGEQYSFGLPLSQAYKRAGDKRVVQYFEAAVLQRHPEARRDEEYGELGRFERLMAVMRIPDLGRQYAEAHNLVFPPPTESVPGGTLFRETGHYLPPELRSFYKRVNGNWRLGAPISELMNETIGGQTMQVQWFERGKVIINPETEVISFAALGRWRWEVQCASVNS